MKRGIEATNEPNVPLTVGICCMCSCSIDPNPAMMCVNCLKSQVDATEGIQRQAMLPHCGNCDRYLQGTRWMSCEPESRELLGVCLGKIKGLTKAKLVDAGFIYTEEHSKRLKVKLQVQKEVIQGAIMQQSALIEFIVQNLQCEDCQRAFTPHTWKACVQVRQHADHKRTLFWLEQLIIKHDAHDKVSFITERPDGLDFHFQSRSHAQAFANFVQAALPSRAKTSKQLISHDGKSNTYNYKYTILLELCSISRDDLVFIPKAICDKKGGGTPQLQLCHRITTGVHTMNILNLQGLDVSEKHYWKTPFFSVAGRKQLVEFIIMNIEDDVVQPENVSKHFSGGRQKFKLCDVEVARADDLGQNDDRVIVRTHLGKPGQLRIGDAVQGYDLRALNITGPEAEEIDLSKAPDVILVKRLYKRGARKNRKWALKRLDCHINDKKDEVTIDRYADDQDMEDFQRDLEDDPELRKDVLLFKNPHLKPKLEMPDNVHGVDDLAPQQDGTAASSSKAPENDKAMVGNDGDNSESEEEIDDDAPVIDLAELLDGLELNEAAEKRPWQAGFGADGTEVALPDSDDDL